MVTESVSIGKSPKGMYEVEAAITAKFFTEILRISGLSWRKRKIIKVVVFQEHELSLKNENTVGP